MENFYQHFRLEERTFIDRVNDWIRQVEDRNVSYVTYFLNPREFYILKTLVHAQGLQLFSSTKECFDLQLQNQEKNIESIIENNKLEYTKALIAPVYYVLSVDRNEFDIALLQINYFNKFQKITHSQILGTFLGETGIDRREIGDILVEGDCAQIVVTKRLIPLFIGQIKKIAGLTVKLIEVPLSNMIFVNNDAHISVILISSLRLDKTLSVSLKIARNFAVNMIQSGRVKVNYVVIDKNDLQLSVGDLISIKGVGRIHIVAVLGKSKKDKFKVEISTIFNHKK